MIDVVTLLLVGLLTAVASIDAYVHHFPKVVIKEVEVIHEIEVPIEVICEVIVEVPADSEPTPNVERRNREPHEHRYDTMVKDGIWRCGICMKPKPGGD